MGLAPDLPALVAGLPVIALMLVWAVHDGGYDADTWYWGALVILALLTAVVIGRGLRTVAISRPARVALIAFALYVAWSYLSIAWAESPGDALEGSNRALLYLLVFATMLILPWTSRGVLVALLTFTLGVGVLAVVLLFRLASGHDVASLVIDGRLAAPTGYFNSTAALFTIETLLAIALASRRELPGPLRGALIAFACAGLQLAVIVQSRGWLFTLPLVALVTIVILPDRLRVAAAAADSGRWRRSCPCTGCSPSTRRPPAPTAHPRRVERRSRGTADLRAGVLRRDADRVGRDGLASGSAAERGAQAPRGHDRHRPGCRSRCALEPWPRPTATRSGSSSVSGTDSAIRRLPPTGSHFADVGSGRYDFWRVSLDAFVGPSDRRAGTGQLRRLLHNAPPHG